MFQENQQEEVNLEHLERELRKALLPALKANEMYLEEVCKKEYLDKHAELIVKYARAIYEEAEKVFSTDTSVKIALTCLGRLGQNK